MRIPNSAHLPALAYPRAHPRLPAARTGYGLERGPLRDRLPVDLREGPSGLPDSDMAPFTSVYLTEGEWAAEIVNRTVHERPSESPLSTVGSFEDERSIPLRGLPAGAVKRSTRRSSRLRWRDPVAELPPSW